MATVFFLVALASSACTEMQHVSEGSNKSVKMSKQCVQTTFRGTECHDFIAHEKKLQTMSQGVCTAPSSGHICCQDVMTLEFRLLGLEQSRPADCAKQICKYIEDMTSYDQMLTSGHVCVKLSARSESEPSNKISCSSDTRLNVQRRFLIIPRIEEKEDHYTAGNVIGDVIGGDFQNIGVNVVKKAGDLMEKHGFTEKMDTCFGLFPEGGKTWLFIIAASVAGLLLCCCACCLCPWICCALDCIQCLCPCLGLDLIECCLCCCVGGKE